MMRVLHTQGISRERGAFLVHVIAFECKTCKEKVVPGVELDRANVVVEILEGLSNEQTIDEPPLKRSVAGR